jgi:hypothetical protein
MRALLLLAVVATLSAADQVPDYSVRIGGEVLHANTLEFAGLTFRDVVAKPRFEGSTITFEDCQATAYGGKLKGTISLDLKEKHAGDGGNYHVHCELSDIDLGTVLSEFGGNSANITGVLSGWADLDIPARNPTKMTGRGELSVDKGSLVQLPLLANLLIGDPTSSKGQDSANARFECLDGQIHIKVGRLVSPAARIAVKGTIGFDGDLRLYLIPRFKFDLIEQFPGLGPVVAPLLSSATSRVARALVRGQVTRPVLVINPFLRDD